MGTAMDIVLINPGDRKAIYQNLGTAIAAIEPPFWVAVTAAYLRNRGFSVAIVDANAENITPGETAARVAGLNPLLAAVIVYGSQPSASTQTMPIAGRICAALKEATSAKVAIGGLHPSALPQQTMREESVDFVIEGEGPYTLEELLPLLKEGIHDYSAVPGLWWRVGGEILHTPRAPLISDLDTVLPIAAWDLLPMANYRAHNWHCFGDIAHRMPYAAIYTSLGCPYNCVFCCINAPFGRPGIRYRSPELVVKEIDLLVEHYGVKNIKIVDELFVLDEKHYMKIVDLLIMRGHNLNIWAYARVDTVKAENLRSMKRAGINWLALGIESANPEVRDQAVKRMRVSDIMQVVQSIKESGIRVIGNYIFGLPQDSPATMQETLDLAIELNCEFANFYCAMAYPGSRLYDIALERGWRLPANWIGYSQHSYEALPLPTEYLSARDVLKFRDNAFHSYFTNADYLDLLERTFGKEIRKHMEEITTHRLKRRILEE
jgi:radical SAM superfamily enzyme YgiQ (UPF0313 family)